jgi:exonuclease 3'-5' domain-containing protein 1
MRDIKTEIINTMKQVGDLVDWLTLRHSPPEPYEPTMYIDLEGVNLCREGSLSILILLIDTGIPTIRVCLIDIYSLGSQVFNTTGIKGKTLKDILHNEKIPKVFFDVRNDSDALSVLSSNLNKSPDPDTTCLPSGEKATNITELV